jgi:hypothetical protein
MLRRKVLSNNGDHAHLGEVAGGKRKMSRSATKAMIYNTRRCLNAIEGYRSYYEN